MKHIVWLLETIAGLFIIAFAWAVGLPFQFLDFPVIDGLRLSRRSPVDPPPPVVSIPKRFLRTA